MSAALPIGRLRYRLAIESPLDTTDDNGGADRTWVAAGTLWASITPTARARRFAADREEQAVTHTIIFRRRDGLTAAMRLRAGARLFRILAIEDADGLARFTRALCEETGP